MFWQFPDPRGFLAQAAGGNYPWATNIPRGWLVYTSGLDNTIPSMLVEQIQP